VYGECAWYRLGGSSAARAAEQTDQSAGEAAGVSAEQLVEETRMADEQRQLSFLDARPYRPPAVPVRTSIAAAEAIAEAAPTLRGKVYTFLAGRRREGATRQEIADGLQMRLQTVCGRVNELLGQNLVWQGDETRDGRKVVRVRE
jgi:hypothetical protein